jgi:hypothetical protein
MGLASAWPPAELLDALRAGAAEALDVFAAGDVLGARKRWAQVGGMLSLLAQQPGIRCTDPVLRIA